MTIRITGLVVLLAVFARTVFAQDPVTIHLAGDSTMAPKTEDARPETGWGEPFAALVDAGGYVVDNRAVNGESTRDIPTSFARSRPGTTSR